MSFAPTPKTNAMLLCDYVITEQGSHKKSLIGIFENIGSLSVPFVHHSLCVYIKLTEARGNYRFHLELVDLSNDKVIGKGEIPGEVSIPDPLASRELVYHLRGIKFDHAGEYEFRIFANDSIFGQKSFTVGQIQPKSKPKSAGE
jgi:hypothetical protein